jgi:hypothetical protein
MNWATRERRPDSIPERLPITVTSSFVSRVSEDRAGSALGLVLAARHPARRVA